MIGRLLRHPLPYLVLLIGLAHWHTEASGWFRPQTSNDTISYEHLLKATTVEEAMSGLRTFGYPLVIRTFGLDRDGWAPVPQFHFLLYAFSILVFYLAVSRFSRSHWMGFAAAAPLCFAATREHVRLVVTDSIAESLGLVVVSLLLLLVVGRARALTATLLGLAIFASYWIRPIYQFLVVLIPLLGGILSLCHDSRRRVAWGRWTLGLAALTIGPLLLFSAVRWFSVGEFRLSSLTGYHTGSIGALMLDDELVAEMPDDTRSLARQIMEQRNQLPLAPLDLTSPLSRYQGRRFGFVMFSIAEPLVLDLVLAETGRVMKGGVSTDLGPLDIPGVMGPTALEMDRRLGRLGQAAIRARPLVYARWVLGALRTGIVKAYSDPWLGILMGLLVLSIPALTVRASQNPALFDRDWSQRSLSLLGLALVAAFYFLGHTMMIALVHWPKDRYAVAANLLLPALAGAALFELWRWIVPHDNGRERQAGAGSRVIGAGLALVIFILMVEALFRTVGVDFDQNKRAAAAVPIFYRQPSRPTGSIFFHRAGPAVWKGPVLKDGPEVEIHYDAAGFRNSPELADWEVVVVGDGFVEAGYLPDDRLFTSELSRRSGLRVKNLGTGSTGLLTHIHYLETWGVAPSTRHAVLVFNEGNDLNDLRTETSRLRRFQETGRREVLRAPLPQSSLLRATYRSLERLRASPPIHESSLIPQSANADLVLPGADNPRRVRVFQRIPSREHLPYGMTELLDQGIGQWAQTARDLGLEPWLLYMPSKHRLLFPFIRYDQDVPEPIRNWRPTNLPDLVRTIAEDHGVGFLNPGPRLARASSQGKMVYNPIDVYLSAEGSRQVGRFLASRFAPKKADSATEANHDPP